MIAYEVETGRAGKLTVSNSSGETVTSDSLEELLAFCLMPHPNEFRVFADLNDAAAPLLAKLPIENIKELVKKKKTEWNGFKIIYFQDKTLVIINGRQYAAFYHLGQYFPDLEGLELGEVQKRGEQLVDELWSIDIKPSKLSSPVALLEDILVKLKLPTWKDIPDEVAEGFWEASGRAWTEAIKIGSFKVWDIDCRAAYGSVLANLYDIRYGHWYHQKQIPQGAIYGWGYGRISNKNDISPITFVDKFGKIYNPRGSWPGFLMLPEVRFIENYESGSFNPSDGYWFVPQRRVQPLHFLIWKLYRSREKSALLNRTLKRSIAGVAGLMLQTFEGEGFGKYFNPCWGGTVQSEIRCTKVGGFIYDNHLQDDLIAISTDGCLITREIKVPDDSRMGAWRVDGFGDALVVDSSLVFFGSKRPNQLSYSEAMSLIQAHPLAKRWATKKQRRKTLGDLSSGALASFEDLGKKMAMTVGFSLPEDDDRDRDFPLTPIKGRDLLGHTYESRALQVSRLAKPPVIAYKEERL